MCVIKFWFHFLVGGGAAALLRQDRELTTEQKLKVAEKACNDCVTQSCVLASNGEFQSAIEKAREAFKKDEWCERQRQRSASSDVAVNTNISLTVKVNLACHLQSGKQFDEALTIFQQLIKNEENSRFRVNIGQIYYAQRRFSDALKMFRMTLDQLESNREDMRPVLLRYIGHCFFQMREFLDAIENYRAVLNTSHGAGDRCTAMNLMLCHYARDDKNAMKELFIRMCEMKVFRDTDYRETRKKTRSTSQPHRSHRHDHPKSEESNKEDEIFDEFLDDLDDNHMKYTFAFPREDPITGQRLDDPLKTEFAVRRRHADRYLTICAKLIAPVIERTPELGYECVKDILAKSKADPGVVTEARLAKATYFLRKKDFEAAVSLFKEFEGLDSDYQALAATSLSFLAFLEGKLAEADKYADLAIKADRYNAHALVNKGICLYQYHKQYDKAKELFLEAIGVEADCVEAIYNLGLVNKDRGIADGDPQKLHDALQAFEKLHSILPSFADALYQLAQVNEALGDHSKAVEWYTKLLHPKCRPFDSAASARLAALLNSTGDTVQALSRYQDAHRANPSNVDVAIWLGVHFVRNDEFEAAIPFFRRAAEVHPKEPKWPLMVAACLRRTDDTDQAIQMYEDIHKQFPEDVECLKFLVILCQSKGLACEEYQEKLSVLQSQDDENFGNRSAVGGNATRTFIGAEVNDSIVKEEENISMRIGPGGFNMQQQMMYGQQQGTVLKGNEGSGVYGQQVASRGIQEINGKRTQHQDEELELQLPGM